MILTVISILFVGIVHPNKIYVASDFFISLDDSYSDLTYGYHIFTIKNTDDQIKKLSKDFFQSKIDDVYKSKDNISLEYFILQNVTKVKTIPIYTQYTSCVNANNSQNLSQQICNQIINTTYNLSNYISEEWVSINKDIVLINNAIYKIKVIGKWKPSLGKVAIDWIPSFTLLSTKFEKSDWAWWNTTYGRCKNVTLSSTSTNTSIPVLINVTYDADMATDFSDLRFVNAPCNAGGSEIGYWIQNTTASSYADAWVNATNINSSAIYGMYYKATGAIAVSNGATVFDMWDDCSGSTFNTTVWTNSTPTNMTFSGGWCRMNPTQAAGNNHDIETAATFPLGYSFFVRILSPVVLTNNFGWKTPGCTSDSISDCTSSLVMSFYGDNTIYYYGNDHVANLLSSAFTWTANESYSSEYIRNGTLGLFYKNGTFAASTTSVPTGSLAGGVQKRGSGAQYLLMDYAFVRKTVSASITVAFDVEESAPIVNNAPNITINTANNSIFSTGTPNIAFTAIDDSNATNLEATLRFNETKVGTNTSIANNTQSTITVNSSRSDGDYTVNVTVNDTATPSLTGSAIINVSIDTTVPVLTVNVPSSNQTFSNRNVSLNFTSTDLHRDKCYYSLNGGANTNIASCNNLTSSILANLGSNTIQVFSNDTAGNLQNGSIISFTVNDAPNVTIGNNINNTVITATGLPIINITAIDDANATGLDCNIRWNGTNRGNNAAVANNTLSGITTNGTALSDGVYNLSATCLDSASYKMQGNSTNYNVTIDLTNPIINYESLTQANNVFLKRNYIEINVTYTEANIRSLSFFFFNNTNNLSNTTVRGAPNPSTFINFTGLLDGTYYYNVTISDMANNNATTTARNITLDNAIPAIVINAPTNNSVSLLNNIIINFSASDVTSLISKCFMQVDSGANNSLTNCANTSTGIMAEGNHNITIWANDSADNSNFTRINITVDTLSPVINYETPTSSNNVFVSRSYIDVNVTYNETNIRNITFRLANSTLSVINTTTRNGTAPSTIINFSALADGTYWYNVTIQDVASNSAITSNRNITLDTVIPVVTIEQPTEGIVINTSSVALNFSVADIYVNQCWYSLNSGANVSLTNCANTTLSLTNGTQNIRIYSNDTANNIGQSVLRNFTVNISNTRPNLTSTTVNHSVYQTLIPIINMTCIDDNNATGLTTEIFWNGTAYGKNTSTLNNTLTSITTNVSLSQGHYNLTLNCTDAAASPLTSFNLIYNLTIDTIIPAINYENPTLANNIYRNQTWIDLNITYNETNVVNLTLRLYNSTGQVINTTVRSGSNPSTAINYTNQTVGYYLYNVTIQDEAGNIVSTTTRNITLDITIPLIENVTNSSITSSSFIVTWNTDDLANSTLNYNGLSSASASFVTSHSIALTGLTASTNYSYNITSCNNAGLCNTSLQFSVLTSAAAVSGNSQAGGGGGGAGAGNRITGYVSTPITSSSANTLISLPVIDSDLRVTSIVIFPVKDILEGQAVVQKLSNSPAGISAVPGNVFQYIEMKVTTYSTGNKEENTYISPAANFRIPRISLTEKSVKPEEVGMYRYSNNAWTLQQTVITGIDSEYVYYQAKLKGFSYFAISTIQPGVPIDSVAGTASDIVVTGQAVVASITGSSELNKPVGVGGAVMPFWVLAVIVLGIIIAIYLLARKR